MLRNRRNGEECSYIHYGQKMRYKGGYYNDKKHGKGTFIITQEQYSTIMKTN